MGWSGGVVAAADDELDPGRRMGEVVAPGVDALGLPSRNERGVLKRARPRMVLRIEEAVRAVDEPGILPVPVARESRLAPLHLRRVGWPRRREHPVEDPI